MLAPTLGPLMAAVLGLGLAPAAASSRRTGSPPPPPGYPSDDPPASGLFVPLKVDNAVIGIVAVQSRRVRAFRRREEFLMRVLAGSVATTLAAMSWRGEVQARERQIALLEDVARLLTPLRPLSAVLPEVADRIATRLEASTAAVFEISDERLVPLASAAGRAETGFAERPEVLFFVQSAAASRSLVTRSREQDAPGHPSPHVTWEGACPLPGQ